jgi:uncharacterized protein YdaU (DUF1376 family)
MNGRWYKRCGADFIHGTMSLSLEEKGAYSLCLDLIYDRGGPIPDDARWLSGVCGVSIRKWNSLRQSLISAGKIYVANGLLSNVRADFELVSTEFQRRKQAESGAKGGRKSAEIRVDQNKNNDLGEATLKPIDKIRGEENTLPKGNGASASSDAKFWDSAKTYLAPHNRNPGALIGKWCRDHGKPATASAIGTAQIERAVDPVPYIERTLRGAKQRSEVSLC